MTDLEPLLSELEVSKLTGRSTASVQNDRRTGAGPFYVKLGRNVRYRPADVANWLDARLMRCTAEYSPDDAT
jgi:predicted DNA-binding transcriptional regulator AlpA